MNIKIVIEILIIILVISLLSGCTGLDQQNQVSPNFKVSAEQNINQSNIQNQTQKKEIENRISQPASTDGKQLVDLISTQIPKLRSDFIDIKHLYDVDPESINNLDDTLIIDEGTKLESDSILYINELNQIQFPDQLSKAVSQYKIVLNDYEMIGKSLKEGRWDIGFSWYRKIPKDIDDLILAINYDAQN